MKKVLDVINFIFGGLFNIAITVAVIFIVYTGTVKGFEYGKSIFNDENSLRPSQEVVISIPQGADPLTIGKILKEKDLVKNEYIFFLQTRLNGSYKHFQYGDFTLNMNMESGQIMSKLQEIRVIDPKNDLRVTIVEGMTNKQIGEYMESEGFFTAEEFLEECENGVYTDSFLPPDDGTRPNRLEGYLFPDTYNLPQDPTPRDLIVRMLSRFDEIMDYDKISQAEAMGLSIDDVIIRASIVEKEVKVPDERAKVAAVINNRMKQDMPLQMCSTVMYVLDKRKDRLLLTDLEIPSDYNTYLHSGLPIGAIANPGEAAINAVLNPADIDALYFVVRDDKVGDHFFTSSYEEFTAAKVLYNQKF